MDTETLRKFCLSLTGATEDVKWEADLCFLVGNKMFCITGFEPGSAITLKVKDEDFENYISRNGFQPAPYLARAKWINIENSDFVKDDEIADMVRQSYELIKSKLPKKLQREIDA